MFAVDVLVFVTVVLVVRVLAVISADFLAMVAIVLVVDVSSITPSYPFACGFLVLFSFLLPSCDVADVIVIVTVFSVVVLIGVDVFNVADDVVAVVAPNWGLTGGTGDGNPMHNLRSNLKYPQMLNEFTDMRLWLVVSTPLNNISQSINHPTCWGDSKMFKATG